MNISCALVPLKNVCVAGFSSHICSLLFVLLQFAKLPGASSSLPFPPAFSSPEWLSQSPLRGSACSSERSGIVGPVTPSLPERAYTPVSLPRELNIKWVEGGGEACLLLSPSLSIMHPSVVLAQWNLAERKDISRGGGRGDVARALIPENRRFSNATVLPFLETFPQRPIRE